MRFYLTDKEYTNTYGKSLDRNSFLGEIEQYNSIESMEEKLKDKDWFLSNKIRAFNKTKLEIDTLVDNLKSGKEYIRNLEYIYENPVKILEDYEVTKEFECLYDPDYGEIEYGVEKAIFTIDGDKDVEISFNDLCSGFELGLTSIEEVGMFLLKHGSLKIDDCLE